MYIDNKYYRIYFEMINSIKKLNRIKLSKDDPEYVYYENHHIRPKSCKGSDDDFNLILLTPREHYIAHKLLTKFVKNKYKSKMYSALLFMSDKGKLNSKQYSKARIEANKLQSKNSGKNHWTKRKINLLELANKQLSCLERGIKPRANNMLNKKQCKKLRKIKRSLIQSGKYPSLLKKTTC